MTEKTKSERIARVVSVLLFVGIYVVGLVMGLQEMAQRAAAKASTASAHKAEQV